MENNIMESNKEVQAVLIQALIAAVLAGGSVIFQYLTTKVNPTYSVTAHKFNVPEFTSAEPISFPSLVSNKAQ
jgi:hypothetical protein